MNTFVPLKILAALCTPPASLAVGVVLALVLTLLRWRRLARVVLALAIAHTLVLAFPPVGNALMGYVEGRARESERRAPACCYDAIMVLGGAIKVAYPPARPFPELHDGSDRIWQAARLYRRSAEFRAVEDPIGLQCLTDAAAVAYAAGDRSAARSDMAHAAERALARGDIRSAAMAYLDAAWIAQEQRKPDRVWDLGHRAELLAESPLLSENDRSAIQRRIERVPGGTRLVIGKRVNG